MRKTFIGDLLAAMRTKEGFTVRELAMMLYRDQRLVKESLELAIRQGAVVEEQGRYRKARKKPPRQRAVQLGLFGR